MATTAKSDRPTAATETTEPSGPPARRRRWPWYMAACLLLVAAAPTLVCKTPLRDVGLAAMLRSASLHGQATTGSVSVGWLSPVVVTNLEFRGPDGEILASLPELSIDKSLLGLLLDRADPGRIRLQKPQIVLRVRDDGSNVEDVFADVLAKAKNEAGIAVEIEVADGTITLDDVAAKREWKMEQVALQIVRPHGPTASELSFTAAMPQTSAESHIKLQAKLSPPAATDATTATESGEAGSTATFEAVQFPLESLRAIVARTAPDVALAGQLDGQLEFTTVAGGKANEGSLVGDITVANLLLASPRLGDDVLKIARIELPCKLSLRGTEVSIEQLAMRSDVGQMTCKANLTLAPAETAGSSRGEPMPRLTAAAGQVTGQIDLAQLARLLPHTMRFRPGTELASAPVNFSLSPRLRRDNGWLLEMDAGRVLDHVHVTPELCDAWLKFALPVLAEVTQVDGEFSVDLEGGRLPLENPPSGETAGTIAIHSIELEPGPLSQQFLPVIETLRGLVGRNDGAQALDRLSVARDSQVEFRIVDGRVYHRGLRLQFPQMTVETFGSVGFDESLAMIAEISLPDKLLGNGPIGTAIKSRPLQLPIGGTLKKPKVDVSQLRGFGNQTVRETAKGLIGEKVERELNRLLKPESR